MTRAGRLSIALIALALAGVAVGPADADIIINVPGVAKTTVPVPTVSVPPGHGPLKVQPPNVEVTIPRDGSRPTVTVGPGHGTPTPPPVSTPPTPPPASDPPATGKPTATTPATSTTPAATPAATAAQPTATTTSTTARTPAAQSAPAPQSHTVAPLTRSGSAARGLPTSSPPRPGARTTFVADATSRAPTAPRATKRPSRRAAAKTHAAKKPHRPSSIGAAIGDVVDRLPGWVLAVFLGFAALAAGMAVNAYANSRRARRLAVQRAELVDDVGHLQAALLAPVPPTPDDVSFSVAYLPAAGLAAGGDFYDVFELDGDRIAMLLGDVSGHGRESVAHAALVRYTLRTFIAAGHEPAEAIALTDPCLDGHMDGQFATVIAAIYDHAAHTLTYAKAGHHPPLVLGLADDATVASSSPPIGAGLGARPSDVTLDVAPGATVCFFTDGLVEARRGGTPLGPERVERMLAGAPDDAEALIAAVAAEADELNDDLAVCLLHRPADATAVATSEPARVPQPVAG